MHSWFKNYLLNRRQFTVVNGVTSSLENITCGVPQGSVLGPLLFLLYINDISNATGDDLLKLFADDTNLFIAARSIPDLELNANCCLKKWNAGLLPTSSA